MGKALGKWLMWVLLLAAQPLAAQEPIIGLTAQEPIIERVKVVTGSGRPADCLAPVAINRIDGVRQVVPAHGFLIEPGVHSLNGRATLDTSICGPVNGDLQIPSAPDLVVNFEVGRTYHVAYDRRSQNTDEWRLVVWKVEQPDLPQDQPQDQPQDPIQQ